MKLLRTVLYLQALLAFIMGFIYMVVPGLVVSVMGIQAPPDRIFMRLLGGQALVIGMLAVLVAQKADDHWWWAWAFALGDLVVAAICLIKAGFGPAPSWPWWLIGLVHGAFGVLTAYAMAAIGTTRQPDGVNS